MKTSAFVLAAALCFSAAAASAQSLVPTVSGQPGSLGQPAAHSGTRYLAGGGSVTYFEAVPTHETQHPQFAQLRQAFASSKPTLVLYQWPDCGTDSTEAVTIARRGAGGYVQFLAHQLAVPTQRFDDCVAEYEYLRAHTSAAQLKLYCLLREGQRYHARTGVGATKASARRTMRQLLANSTYFLPGTEQVLRTLPELEAAYRTYCPTGGKWWALPASFFTPGAPASQTGPALAAVNQALGDYRTQQLQRLAADKARAGQRVLVVMAPGYLPAGPAGQLAHR